ncbi:transcription/translation regulatory transformer protein RfaH [Pseudidiomarina gelatinasegens]|uniref:Transcription/translation regulatory transformer protein RfaH n=1 Tax=Pseudidiomarina gelatinasegens TaxID=2487740 RepID=A0A443Z7Q4_9GAMM|nr:transcription/translation regulatory transformer protein RfaH [Pseudidiomarina gelatinasegens]RWU12946.1 transcription/translation regulatory transformer protein RfaH [Pseudidiomarina gelatinasegens]
MKWYVIRTKPRQEQRALVNLENQDIAAYLPQVTLQRVRRGKRTAATEALFPGYIFAQLDDFAGRFHKIRSTFGVQKMLMFGEQPATIPDALIEELKNIELDPHTRNAAEHQSSPQVNDNVEISTGPFAGFVAKIIELDGDSRCIVLLDWLQQEVKATFSYNDLNKI